MTKNSDNYYKSFNVVYRREYFDSEQAEYFWSSYSLYKNVPISKLKYYRKQLLKFKDYMDSLLKKTQQTLLVLLLLR